MGPGLQRLADFRCPALGPLRRAVALIYGTGTVVFGTVKATVIANVTAPVVAPIALEHHGGTITNYATEI